MKHNNKNVVCLLFVIFLIVFSLFVSCQSNVSSDGNETMVYDIPARTYKQAIYIYMCGSTLEATSGWGTKAIQDMLSASVPDDSCIVIVTGGCKKWKNFNISTNNLSYYVITGNKLLLVDKKTSASMGESSTLENFLSFCLSKCPAEKTGLIFWDHGTGSNGGVCYDTLYNYDYLSIPEIESGLQILKKQNKKLDFIGFDTCLMANYETVVMAARYADNMVASEELEPGSGWDYSFISKNFLNDNFYTGLLNSYSQKCESENKSFYTLSHINLTRIPELEAEFTDFCTNELTGNAIKGLKTVVQGADKSIKFGGNSKSETYSNMIDLSLFASNNGNSSIPQIIEQIVSTVNGEARQNAKGISFYYPLADDSDVESYIKWSSSDKYNAFLELYYKTRNPNANLIEFKQDGDVTSENELFFEVTKESLAYIRNVYYKVYRFLSTGTLYYGYDSDVVFDNNDKFTTNFGGRWVTVNGKFIQSEIVEQTEKYTIFSSPVKCNGKIGNLRFSYNHSNYKLHLLGFIPLEENSISSRLHDVNVGDKIVLIQGFIKPSNRKETPFQHDEFVVGPDLSLSVQQLPDDDYVIWAVVTDLYGKEYRTNAVLSTLENGKLTSSFVLIYNEDDNYL